MTDTSRAAVERLIEEAMIALDCNYSESGRLSNYNIINALRALLVERDAAQAQVARLKANHG